MKKKEEKEEEVLRTEEGRGEKSGARRARHGFTLVEMLIVFFLSSVVLGLFLEMYYGGLFRVIGVFGRVEGEQSVRILLTRLRHELRSAVGLVQIDKQGKQLTIPLLDMAAQPGEGGERPICYTQYEYEPSKRSIFFRRLDPSGNKVAERLWLGGETPVENFLVMATSENDRILFQYYRVILEIDYRDIKLRDKNRGRRGEGRVDLIHVTCTVYPRRVNMELRIEVPQAGGTL